MKKIYFSIFAFLLWGSAFIVHAKDFGEPEIPMDEALKLARQYVDSNNIDISNHYIGSAEYHIRFGLVSFWRIEWRIKKIAKGDQVIVNVRADGKMDHGYGE